MLANATLSSFDGTETVAGRLARPERYSDLFQTAKQGPFIARGSGLSYCAASMGENAISVSLKRFDRILNFDEKRCTVTVEPGIETGALLNFVLSRGFTLPVVPGHPSISIGGCAGFNVHGKSQYHGGLFSEWVEELTVFHPAHGELECTPRHNADVFHLTLGGFGLTGIMTSLKLRLMPLSARTLEVESLPVKNLFEATEVMKARAEAVAYLYSWNDLNLTGEKFGKGVVYVERFSDTNLKTSAPFSPEPLSAEPRRGQRLWSRPFIRAANTVYGVKERRARKAYQEIAKATFPIAGKEFYYRWFGRQGFREYQILVPLSAWETFVEALKPLLERFTLPITLGSLKLFRGHARHLWFSGEGVCLALDTPATPKSLALFGELDSLAIATGSLVNISKDSRLSAGTIDALYPGWSDFRRELHSFDPKMLVSSSLRRRLNV